MNELGNLTDKLHIELIQSIERDKFKSIILCGEFYQRNINKITKINNECIYLSNKINLMKYLNKNIHNNDIIMIKCSNSTQVNEFTKSILKKKVIKID